MRERVVDFGDRVKWLNDMESGMKEKTILLVVLVWFLLALGCGTDAPTLVYPEAHKGDTVDDLHGVKVADPYRWLEKGDAPETRTWIEAQNEVTEAFLGAIPQRDRIRKRLTELWNYEKYTVPVKRGGRYFYRKNDGLQNQSVLYTVDTLRGKPRVLLDPNKLSKDGTVSVASTAISEDGTLMAYSTSSGGADWRVWKVRDVTTGKDRPDRVDWSKFSGASWTHDNKGFYYSRYNAPREGEALKGRVFFHKLYYHRLGTSQDKDVLVCHDPDNKHLGFGGFVTEDGEYLCIRVWKGTSRENMFYYKRLDDADAGIVKLIDRFEASFDFIGNDGPVFWFKTSNEAPLNRVIAIDTRNPARENWKEILPEVKETLVTVVVVGDRFVARYLKDACTRVKIFALDGTFVRDLDLPGLGSAGGFSGRRKDTETFYAFSGYNVPPTIYRYDMKTGKSRVLRAPKVKFDPRDYVSRQVFYKSKDGTRIPLFLTHKKGLTLDGNNPVLLYGYGGFNIPLTPGFRVDRLVWMEMGGVYAVACIRGGGEYGKAWHQAGSRLKKQNCFDDFIAAAEWLVAKKYTKPTKLAIFGGSNGGLLVGACMIQRPDLFGACLPAVGVMDMLRFHKFTIGHAWTSDYGSPEKLGEFKVLHAYSPVHNLKPGTSYPATLVTTADHDDRVFPAHSFKFTARLQECQAGPAPVLIRIETRAGHGAGKPTSKRIEEAADRWTFLVRTLRME